MGGFEHEFFGHRRLTQRCIAWSACRIHTSNLFELAVDIFVFGFQSGAASEK